ncbi:tetratricopeptide repeat protein [Thermoflexibacter ruber]|uniref:Serine phosphatase RsbU, regulator of sigma subunit n=1 Tax=Thermoflexibacter ruber TaxID=1003 RepID=A0A1I2BQJ7_9BACT|nr:tetratricopeptide repeat protein [Thermoflexibacter ruber]SFE58375.1 Serine phosphatase RsbU, regulator of sigma subunit [Thermoflexibacter ruber]
MSKAFLKYIFSFFVLLYISIVQSIFAQNSDSLLTTARAAKVEKDLPTALRNYLQAIKILEKEQEKRPEIKEKLAPIYIEIGQIYEEGNLHENALTYFKKSNELDEKANTNEQIADELLESRKYEEAISYYNKALKTYRTENNYPAIIRNLRQIANAYKKLNQYEKALESNIEILNLARQAKDKGEELTSLNNLGYIHRYLKNYTKALDFLSQTLVLQRTLKESLKEQVITLVNIGVVNQNIGNYTNALDNLLQALQIAQKQKDIHEICKIQDLIAVVYLNSKDLYNAENYNESSVEIAENLRNPYLLQAVYETKSNILQVKEDFQNALSFYKKYAAIRDSLELSERIAQQELLQQQFLVERNEKNISDEIANEEARKAEIQQIKGEIERQRLAMEKEAEKLRADEEKEKAEKQQAQARAALALKELEILKQQREAEKDKLAIAELEKEKVKQDLEIEKNKAADKERQRQIAQLEQEKKIQTLEALQQAEENNFLYAVLLFILISTLIAIYALFNVRKKNKLLAQQKDEIEVKNTELEQTQEELKSQRDTLALKTQELDLAYNNIKASITYAKRIQEAILPPTSLIQQYLPESFILYKPRDIVSGDFYWFAPISEKLCVIAVVDCTGHGVPGAFMSMIGDSLLNQIVLEKGIISPDLILSELDKGIKQALRKGEADAKDGMDMAICVIDQYKKFMEFAGAMNPICIVQNNELREIKADKRAIGGDTKENHLFTKHTIDISIPTMTYMYSDGFQDQFGGEHGKKFMVKRFRELLFSLHSEPIQAQKQLLDQTIEAWKGKDHKQIDDILVMGFRV